MESSNSVEKVVGIEASRTTLKAVLAQRDGTVIDAFGAVRFDGKDALERIAEFSSGVKERFGDFSAIGVAVPGLVNKQDGGGKKHAPKKAAGR
jgi:predicted NBD/HSP70 family sugar kinase